jgi:uncharacterized protein
LRYARIARTASSFAAGKTRRTSKRGAVGQRLTHVRDDKHGLFESVVFFKLTKSMDRPRFRSLSQRSFSREMNFSPEQRTIFREGVRTMKNMFTGNSRVSREPNTVPRRRNPKRNCLAVTAFLLVAAAVSAQSQLKLDGLPGQLTWRNSPKASRIEAGKALSISSGPKTDWFVDPFDGTVAKSAPILWFTPGDTYGFSTKVQVQFTTRWDAGALMLWADEHHWAKLSFELSPEKQPMMVTVVTRGFSDDCNSAPISGDSAYLQIARTGSTYVFYYASDGEEWRILRTFRLDTQRAVFVGFEAQSPDGTGATAIFSNVHYSPKKIANIYTGK